MTSADAQCHDAALDAVALHRMKETGGQHGTRRTDRMTVAWRIWPGDIALTLNWLPTTDLLVSEIDDEFCSHALIDQTGGSRVRVIEASEDWPVEHVRRSMKEG